MLFSFISKFTQICNSRDVFTNALKKKIAKNIENNNYHHFLLASCKMFSVQNNISFSNILRPFLNYLAINENKFISLYYLIFLLRYVQKYILLWHFSGLAVC
jgi:hypothetical protein